MSVNPLVIDITELIGEEVLALEPFASGNTSALYLCKLCNGENTIAKHDTSDQARLDIEGYMLDYLHNNSQLPIPKTYGYSSNLLVMDFIVAQGKHGKGSEIHAAQLLADLHTITQPQFGLEKDTVIGPLHQPNTPEDDWITFFTQHRLLYMANQALEQNAIDAALYNKIEALTRKLKDLLPPPKQPSLIHGDIWQGNILCHNDKVAAFIDPAIYYAHPEIELAFVTLFHSLGRTFFDTYNEIHPIDQEFFTTRKDIYNLYPLLVHTILFGSNYRLQVEHVVNRFI